MCEKCDPAQELREWIEIEGGSGGDAWDSKEVPPHAVQMNHCVYCGNFVDSFPLWGLRHKEGAHVDVTTSLCSRAPCQELHAAEQATITLENL